MDKTITNVEYKKFYDIVGNKSDPDSKTYGFVVYNDWDNPVYKDGYETLEELKNTVTKYTILGIIKENFEDVYDTIMDELVLKFNGEIVEYDTDGHVVDDDDDETLLPDESTLPNGEPKYVLNVSEEEAEEISKEIEEAGKDLLI